MFKNHTTSQNELYVMFFPGLFDVRVYDSELWYEQGRRHPRQTEFMEINFVLFWFLR